MREPPGIMVRFAQVLFGLQFLNYLQLAERLWFVIVIQVDGIILTWRQVTAKQAGFYKE